MYDSVRRMVKMPSEVIFVANGSPPEVRAWMKRCAEENGSARVRVIENDENLGFARAINQAADLARGDLLWLNNDAEFVRPGSVERLYKTLESDPTVGAVGPVSDCVLGPQTVFDQRLFPPVHEVRFLIGFCLLLRRSAWEKVGPVSTEFNFAGEDDLDYSIRVAEAGFRLVCNREVFVHHLGGASQPDLEVYRARLKQNRAKLVKKWGEERVEKLFQPLDFSRFRVLVAVPSWNGVMPEAYSNHMHAFTQEERQGAKTGLQLNFASVIRSAICPTRNEIARRALDMGATHLFFMDDDMLMPTGAIHRLVSRNVPIVSGLTHLRTPPYFPSMFLTSESGDGRIYYLRRWPEEQLIEVDAVGSACILIQTEVFRTLMDTEIPGRTAKCPSCAADFQPEAIKPKGSSVFYLYGRARPGERTVGEDVYFCSLARLAGYKILVDTSIRFGHLGMPVVYDTEYFKNVRDKNQVPGIDYTTYQDTKALIEECGGVTPDDVASFGHGSDGERSRRLYAGACGDGRDPESRPGPRALKGPAPV